MKRFNIFRTKKSQIFETACRYFRSLDESGVMVEIERMNGGDYIRMAGNLNGMKYQTHINSPRLAVRLGILYNRETRGNDTELLQIFALSCACADYGEFFDKYRHMWRNLVLNYSR